MTTRLNCPMCHGTGSISNNAVFYGEGGKAPEVSITCSTCKGEGSIEVDNPVGLRISYLIAKKIKDQYPQFRSWEEIYQAIVVNISNAANGALSSVRWAKQPINDPTFEDDTVFFEGPLDIDPILEKWIDKGHYMEEAKFLLGIGDKK